MIDAKQLDSCLEKLAQKMNLAGVSAAVIKDGTPVYLWNYGTRSADGHLPVDSDTIFGIASMSKSITSLCMCILASEGKISLDDPVSKWMPEFRLPGQPAEAVLVRHLMNHSSGIPPIEPLEWSIAMNSVGRQDTEWIRTMQETAPNPMSTIGQIMEYLAHCPYPMLGAPGEVMSYSNDGYAVLSYIVDAAAGMPLEEFMQERIFRPLGLKRTLLDNGIEKTRAIAGGNLTSLFEMRDGVRVCDDAWSILPPYRGCAMVKSTAPEIASYYCMLSRYGNWNGEQIIPRKAVELLCGKYHGLNFEAQMTYGLYKRERFDHTICEHSGGLHGVSTKGGLFLGEGYGFSVLCNQGDEDMDELMWCIYNAVMGRPLEEKHYWFVVSGNRFSSPEMLEGSYTGHEELLSRLTVKNTDDGLEADLDGTALSLRYCTGAKFQAYRKAEPDRYSNRYEFLIRDGKAWAVRIGTRVFVRE